MLARQDVEQMQQQFPKITITDPDTGEVTDLQAKHDTTSLGHIFSADASTKAADDERVYYLGM